jgi:nitrite reductase/ring-hydroxylating ferredoxin subunit
VTTTSLIRVANLDELHGDGPHALSADGCDVVVVRTPAGVRAFEGCCPQGALLGEGELDGDTLVCRNHRWRFSVDLGQREGGPQSFMVVSAASDLAPLRRSLLWAASLRSCSSPTSNIRQIHLRSEILRRSGFERNYSLMMLMISVAALVLTAALARRLSARYGAWDATLIAGAAIVLVIVIVQNVLPEINEVPEQISAVVLWRFRVAALGIQVVLWTTIGLLFGVLTERSFAERFGQRLSVGADRL